MVTYRLADSEDYEKINAFYNRFYNTDRTTEQFWWEFHNCPFGKSIYVIAEDNGKIVGTNCVIPIDIITSDKKIIRSGKSEDTLVAPQYRGQRIFYNIYDFLFNKCKEANIQVIWGFTSAKKPFKKLGFEIPYDHQQGLAVNHIWKSYRYLASLNNKNKTIDKIKILGLCLLSKAKITGTLNLFKKTTLQIEKVNKFVSNVDELILENLMKVNNSFAIHQTSDFQEWRIYDNPNYFKTHTYCVHQNKKLVALVIFNSHQNSIAYVCQSTFRSELAHVEKVKILRSVTKMLFNEGITLIRTWSFHTNSLNRGIGLVWKELGDTGLKPEKFILSRIATQGTI